MPRQSKPTLKTRIRDAFALLRFYVLRYIRAILTRRTFAYVFMLSFILLCGIGAGMFNPALGFIVAGVACGIFGFLLGIE